MIRAEVEDLLARLDREAPISYDLGTPELFEVEPVRRLVGLGPAAVPRLVEQVAEAEPRLRTAYVVMALGLIGDQRALAAVRALRARLEGGEDIDEWDRALLAQSDDAIRRLEDAASSAGC